MSYAVIRTGGKQYTVREGQTVKVELLAGEPGDSVELPEVLLISDEAGGVTAGTPTIPGAKVVAEIVGHGKRPKIHVFHYKAKVRYSKRTGHRQRYTQLAIRRIAG